MTPVKENRFTFPQRRSSLSILLLTAAIGGSATCNNSLHLQVRLPKLQLTASKDEEEEEEGEAGRVAESAKS